MISANERGQILEVCYRSGVRVVTIYAFSIENFQRSKHEVEGLMGLAKLKLTQLATHGELLARYGARIKIIGQRELIRADVMEVVHRVEALTANNGDAILNVCFPYTSREEITTAVRSVVDQWATPSPSASLDKPRPFSASHISHHIRSRHLAAGTSSTGGAGGGANSTGANTSPAASDAAASVSDRESSSPSIDSSGATLHGSMAAPDSSLSPISSTGGTSSHAVSSGGDTGTSGTGLSYPDPELIDVAALNAAMHTAGMPPLRLLVRTSGVARFSDFMLWQAHESTDVAFVPCMWPEFDLWRFLPILVEWQWRQRHEIRLDRRRLIRRMRPADPGAPEAETLTSKSEATLAPDARSIEIDMHAAKEGKAA